MAESPAHRFGQIVGNLLEEILQPELQKFCNERDLYLDRHGSRVGVRTGKKVSWEDKFGNIHDLDFVIEKGGTAHKLGRPVAFIEAAWRRYTKHSRNKAQEIQGAVLPIFEKYEVDAPFLGVVLAGEFTSGALEQLRSVGFNVVYLPYGTVIAAFAKFGIDARFNEATPDREFARCVAAISELPIENRTELKRLLIEANQSAFDSFFSELRAKLDRAVQEIQVLPLFGDSVQFSSLTEAAAFLESFSSNEGVGNFKKFEILVRYSNGDEIRGSFANRERAQDFLTTLNR